MINFGAFVAFVNLSVIAHYLRSERSGARSAFTYIAVPAVGFVINVVLWLNLDTRAQIVGAWWAAIGVVHVLMTTRFFSRQSHQFELDAPQNR